MSCNSPLVADFQDETNIPKNPSQKTSGRFVLWLQKVVLVKLRPGIKDEDLGLILCAFWM